MFNPRKYITKNGIIILVGRNSQENNYLTLKVAKPTDIFFHVADLAGSHVILQLEGNEATRNDILEAARLAAHFSKGKDRKIVKVDYTLRKHVKKHRKDPAGMVEIKNHKSIKIKKNKNLLDEILSRKI